MRRVTNISNRLKEYRAAQALTLSEMSAQVGMPAQTLNRYELGQHIPKIDAAAQIAEALEINPLWLIGYDVPMTGYPDTPEAPPLEDKGEQELLSAFHQLNDKGRARVVDYAADLVATGRYMIDDDDKINFTMAAYGGGLYKRTITEEQLDALKKAIEETWE